MTKDEALKLALEKFEFMNHVDSIFEGEFNFQINAIKEALMSVPDGAQPEQESVMILPDGSAFGVMSFRLPDDHWIYAPNEYRDGEYEPIDLPKPILTHQLRDAVVAAVRYAVRGSTMRGQETDFDPDALVQNAVYALCGPYTTPPQRKPLTDEEITDAVRESDLDWHQGWTLDDDEPNRFISLARAIEAKLKEKNT